MFPANCDRDGIFELAFARAPAAMCVSHGLRIAACNPRFAELFNCAASGMVGRSLGELCSKAREYRASRRHHLRELRNDGRSHGELLLRREEGGELRCRVTASTSPGSAFVVWMIEPREPSLPIHRELSPRERQVAALLIKGLSAKQMARSLGLSPRTVEMHRGNLMKKYDAASTPVLVARLHAEEPLAAA